MDKRLLVGLALLVVLVAGCLGPGRSTNYQRKYYQGYESINIKFLSESPPSTFYYSSEGGNEVPIVIEAKNLGSSDAYGALFIHGYDPNLVEIAGSKLPVDHTLSGSGGAFWNPNTGQLNIAGFYIGLSGSGSGNMGTVGWAVPGKNGEYYGGSVFMQDGKFVGLTLDINLGSNRIGSRLADRTLANLQKVYGWSAPIALEGDTPETPGGGMQVYDFPAYIYYLPPSLEQFRQPMMVTACYSYVTRGTAMMCIDPKPNSNSNKACIARDVSLSGGQGAPVAITRVQQQSSNGKVVFTITVHHNKKNSMDEIFDINELMYKCNPHAGAIVKPSDKNIVDILYVELSGHDITPTCSGGGRIRLDESGNGQFTCTGYVTDAYDSAREAPLAIELGYGYGKNIYKEITIKRI